jgi:hypothetical protein
MRLVMVDGVCVEKDLKDRRWWNRHLALKKKTLCNSFIFLMRGMFFFPTMLIRKDCKQGVCPWGDIIWVWDKLINHGNTFHLDLEGSYEYLNMWINKNKINRVGGNEKSRIVWNGALAIILGKNGINIWDVLIWDFNLSTRVWRRFFFPFNF